MTKRLSSLRRALRDPRRAELGLYAANGAYYLFLSLGPLTALLLSLLPRTGLGQERLLEAVSAYAPSAFGHLVRAVAADIYAAPGAALGVSLLAELWGAGALLSSVVRGVGELSGGGRGYLGRRLLGAGYTLALIALLLGDLMLLLAGERLPGAAGRICPALARPMALMLVLRPLVFWAGLSAGNALLFRHAGRALPAFPGAYAAAGAWLLFTRGYSWALERFGLFGVYGSIAAVLVSLYWTYASLYILYLGVWMSALRRDGFWDSAQDPGANFALVCRFQPCYNSESEPAEPGGPPDKTNGLESDEG